MPASETGREPVLAAVRKAFPDDDEKAIVRHSDAPVPRQQHQFGLGDVHACSAQDHECDVVGGGRTTSKCLHIRQTGGGQRLWREGAALVSEARQPLNAIFGGRNTARFGYAVRIEQQAFTRRELKPVRS